MDQDVLKTMVKEAVARSLKNNIPSQHQTKNTTILKEATIVLPRTFVLKTELLSSVVKESQYKIYKSFVDAFNDISIKLDSASKEDASKPENSVFRRLKLDEQRCLNAIKLFELHLTNISDLHSEIRMDSVPFIKLCKDFGTFEKWQFDFRACGLAANEGWAVCYYDTMKQKYINCIVEDMTLGIPVCGIPVIVVSAQHSAWYRDFPEMKQDYLNAMMKELNWAVIEARMVVAEKAALHNLFALQPIVNDGAEKLLGTLPKNQAPINITNALDQGNKNTTYPTPTGSVPQAANLV
jgi:Fe-Mn family superoxide dismutase